MSREAKIRESQQALLIVLQTRVIFQQTKILSGAYKTREVYHGCQCTPENRLTEEELLKEEINTMKRHIERMQEIQEDLIPSEGEE